MGYLKRHSGFTLVELLVVVAIIIIITSVSVPMLVRGGLFSGNKTNAAAVDLFAQLRAAHVYATANNTDTAIAYGVAMRDGNFIQDSLYDPATSIAIDPVPQLYIDNYPDLLDDLDTAAYNPQTAVLGSSIIVRRITIEELQAVGNTATNISLAQAIITEFGNTEFVYGPNGSETFTYEDTKNVFVAIKNNSARFQVLPNDVCVLINHPTMLEDQFQGDQLEGQTGLQGIYILSYEREDVGGAQEFVVTRILPIGNNTDIAISPPAPDVDLILGKIPYRGLPGTLDVNWKNKFPAHVFSKKGGLDVSPQITRQRLQFSVGLYPDMDYFERYLVDEDSGTILMESDLDPINGSDDLVSLTTDIEIYVATGRVKVVDDAL